MMEGLHVLTIHQAERLLDRGMDAEDLFAYVKEALNDKYGEEAEPTLEYLYDHVPLLVVKVGLLKRAGEDSSEVEKELSELLQACEEERGTRESSPTQLALDKVLPVEAVGGGRLEDMGREKKYRVGSKELSQALRWEVQRQVRDDPPDHGESNVQVAERIRNEVRAILIQRGLLKYNSDYPSVDMLRRLVGKLV